VNEIDSYVIVIVMTVFLVVGLISGYYLRKILAEGRLGAAEEEAKRILDEAGKEVEAQKKEILLEAKEEIHRNRQDAEKEIRDRRRELDRIERRILQKEEMLDRKSENMEKKEQGLSDKEKVIEKTQQDLQMILTQQLKELERLSGLSSEEAKELLLYNVEQQIRQETAVMIKSLEAEAKEEADKKS
jgi:metal dependent phosphohydrolase